MRDVRCLILSALNAMMMRKLGVSCLLGACLALGAGELAAQTRKPGTPAEFVDSMARQGWKETASGVLQRQVGMDKTETFAYGREGLQWAVIQAQDRLGFFLREYYKNPSNDGVTAILEQRAEVKRLERALAAAPQTKAGALESFLNSTCDFSYGSTANAYALTGSSAGVGAQATAYFNNSSCSGGNNCGYSGEAYSYAYVSARTGTTTTTKYQRDPLEGVKTGASITSSASLTQTGNADCYSEASSAVTVSALNLYLSSYSSNSSCPVPVTPLQVTAINVSTYLYRLDGSCQSSTWTATVSGGTPAYTYKWYWNGVQVGTGTSYSRTICGTYGYGYNSYSLSVTVTDSVAATASRSTTVSVESDVSGGGGCRAAAGGGVEEKLQEFPQQPIC